MLRPTLTILGGAAIVFVHAGAASATGWLPSPNTSARCATSDAAPIFGYTAAVQGDCELKQQSPLQPAEAARAHTNAGPAPVPAYTCSYVDVQSTVPGGEMFKSCTGSLSAAAPDQPLPVPFLVPKPTPGPPEPAAKNLALSELRNLHLAPPVLRLSPGLNQPQVVNADAWYWLDSAFWQPVSSSVSSAGTTVTVTATPVTATWTSGDGGSVTCAGAGTPYPFGASDPPAQSPTCGHAFTRASAGFPGGVYPLTAQVSWQVGWRASYGETGTFPAMATSATAQVRVVEVQALVTGVRS